MKSVIWVSFLAVAFLSCACKEEKSHDPWERWTVESEDPDARGQLASRLETIPWPKDAAARARAVESLVTWIRRDGVKVPLPIFQRLATELDRGEYLELLFASLKTAPGVRPFPPREDPLVVWILQTLVRETAGTPGQERVAQAMQELLDRLAPVGDPQYRIRYAVAEQIGNLPPSAAVTRMALQLLDRKLPVQVSARVMISLGVSGYGDGILVPVLLDFLWRASGNVNLAPFALAALTGARGTARKVVLETVKVSLLQGGFVDALEALRGHPELGGILGSKLDDWGHLPVHLKDPFLLHRTFARVVSAMGEKSLAAELVRERYFLAQRPADFMVPDGFPEIRDYLLQGGLREVVVIGEEAAGMQGARELGPLATSVARVPRHGCPAQLVGGLREKLSTATVPGTTGDWKAQFRDTALRTALAHGTTGPQLIELWNAQETEENQWRNTAHLWRPFVKLPHQGEKACAADDPFSGMSPDEWIRLKIGKTLFVCSELTREDAEDVSGFLAQATQLAEWEMAWDEVTEQKRRKKSVDCRRDQLEELFRIEKEILDCSRAGCILRLLADRGSSWPDEAVERAAMQLEKFAREARTWEEFPELFAMIPHAHKPLVLDVIEPFLPEGTREQLVRRYLHDRCIQNQMCLPVLLQTIGLGNRPGRQTLREVP